LEPLNTPARSSDRAARESPAPSISEQLIPGEYPFPAPADESGEPVAATAPVGVDREPTGVISIGSEPGPGSEDVAAVAKSAPRGSVFEMRSPEVDRRAPTRAKPDWPVGRGRAAEPAGWSEADVAEVADPWPELPDWPLAGSDTDAIAADVHRAEREELGRVDCEQAGGPWNA
jgi:hypothetical protein